ncbi:MAG: hypothetical protein COC12_06915 [Rhodobacteraceae bacterium]|nr:MAG: hypothetical protein COC12_06915 [Paracoccaceae bacterium]
MVRLEKGALVFERGDPVHSFHKVVQGKVHLLRRQMDGATFILQRAGAGDILAEASLSSASFHCAAEVLEAGELEIWPAEPVRQLLRQDLRATQGYALHLAAQLRDTRMRAEILSLRRVGDLLGQPRAGLARRFGRGLVLRLDQAMGSAPEPVSPARPPHHFAVRLTMPDPIGLKDDLLAGIDRMLPQLCAQLKDKGRGVRTLRFEAYRCDQSTEVITIGLARPAQEPERIRPLLELKLDQIDAGFGIDMLRMEAIGNEPVHARTSVGHLQAGRAVSERLAGNNALDDLIGRLGARVGLEAITRRHPASSHIPEKTAQVLAAAWSGPAEGWAVARNPRPLLLWGPEVVHAPDDPAVPAAFRWRGRGWDLALAIGPERIAPEWWLDDPNWRSGVRDYWVVTTGQGDRLWLFYAHGGAMSSGWFCQGRFA